MEERPLSFAHSPDAGRVASTPGRTPPPPSTTPSRRILPAKPRRAGSSSRPYDAEPSHPPPETTPSRRELPAKACRAVASSRRKHAEPAHPPRPTPPSRRILPAVPRRAGSSSRPYDAEPALPPRRTTPSRRIRTTPHGTVRRRLRSAAASAGLQAGSVTSGREPAEARTCASSWGPGAHQHIGCQWPSDVSRRLAQRQAEGTRPAAARSARLGRSPSADESPASSQADRPGPSGRWRG